MSKFIVNFETLQVYPASNPSEITDFFFSGITYVSGELLDRAEITKLFNERGQEVEFIGSEFSLPTIAHVEISDLIALGWNFDEEDYSGYHAVITVRENGKTFFEIVNSEKLRNGIWEGGDEEPTGYDEQTIKDLHVLQSEGKLWKVKHSIA